MKKLIKRISLMFAAGAMGGLINSLTMWFFGVKGIAAHFGVNVYYLAQANGIWNINYIYVGQVLVIPGD